MIIWGIRIKVAVLAVLTYVCDRCGVNAAHRVTRRTRWFTLFFIPLFPVGTRHQDTCVNCGRTLEITPEQAAAVAGTADPAYPAA